MSTYKIKPLKWVRDRSGAGHRSRTGSVRYTAKTPFVTYQVTRTEFDTGPIFQYGLGGDSWWVNCKSVEEGKQKCVEDWEAKLSTVLDKVS